MFTQKTFCVQALLAVLFHSALAAKAPAKRAEAYVSPLDNGGSMLTNAGDGFGEPLNVRPPTQSILCAISLDSWRIHTIFPGLFSGFSFISPIKLHPTVTFVRARTCFPHALCKKFLSCSEVPACMHRRLICCG